MTKAHAVDEGLFAGINGEQHWITIRGHDRANPALLIVTGPGAAFSRMAPFFSPWERDFTLVQWDQPNAGATFAKNGAANPYTFDRLANDGIAVMEFARERLGTEKIAVLGISGGSAVGVTMAKRRPELFSAFVGTGQIVNWAEQMAHAYALVHVEARAAGNATAIAELEQVGPPPYASVMQDFILSKYANAFTAAEAAAFADPVMEQVNNPPADAAWICREVPASDPRAQALPAYMAIRDALWRFDARSLGAEFGCPMHFVQGDRDTYTVTRDVEAYARDLGASFDVIEGGGHSAVFLREPFLAVLRKRLKG